MSVFKHVSVFIYSQTESPYWGSIVMSGEPVEDFTSVALIWLDIMLTTSIFLKASHAWIDIVI